MFYDDEYVSFLSNKLLSIETHYTGAKGKAFANNQMKFVQFYDLLGLSCGLVFF